MEHHKGSFVATDEEGLEYIINIFVDVINVPSHDDKNATIEGWKRLATDDGLPVNRIRKGEYRIVATDVHLHSDSPDAP